MALHRELDRVPEKINHHLAEPVGVANEVHGDAWSNVPLEREVFDKIKPYLEAMGKRLYYCGGAGMGLHAKLTQNLILSNILQAFNEGMVLAARAGVDPELMLDILDNSAAKSGLIFTSLACATSSLSGS